MDVNWKWQSYRAMSKVYAKFKRYIQAITVLYLRVHCLNILCNLVQAIFTENWRRKKCVALEWSGSTADTVVLSEMSIYRDNLSATIYYRLSLSLKLVLIYQIPISLL